ncbi:MAG: hypothetical protein RTU09_01770 [Candidatus Thorarchaeota archaeon]
MEPEDLYQRHGSRGDRLGDAVAASDVFDRQFGSELAAWELELHREFQERLSGRTLKIRGFAHHTRDSSLILLTPSPWLLEGMFVYFRRDQDLPLDGEFIEVTGRSVAAPRTLERSQETVRAITADAVEKLPDQFLSEVKHQMPLKELSSMLFEQVGMAEASKRVFAQLFISSPPFEESIGGLTAGIQAISSQRQVKQLLGFIRDVLPPVFRGMAAKHRRVRGIGVVTPKLWRMDVGSPSKSRMETLCVKRMDPSGFREVSLSALTDSETGFLPDVPLALTSDDFWVERKAASNLRLPIIKAAVTYQLLTPKVAKRSIEASTKHVLSRLETLKESFDLEDGSMSRGSILDADSLGRPLSTVRLARSSARAYWKDKVTASDLKRSWDRVLEPALKEYLELTQLKTEVERDWGKDRPLHRFNTKILKALKKLDAGTPSSLGPSLGEIAAEAGLEHHIAAKELEQMKNAGALYEPRPGHYRLV